MIWPVKDFWISQGFKPGHQALDLASHGGKYGLPILAPVSGTVTLVGTNPNYFGGLYVIIRDSKGYEHYTGHHQKIHVSKGQTVKQGQRIADMGATGQATGPHTHYQIRNPQGNLINPNVLYANRNRSKQVSYNAKTFKYGKPARNIYEWAKLAMDYDGRIRQLQKDLSASKREIAALKDARDNNVKTIGKLQDRLHVKVGELEDLQKRLESEDSANLNALGSLLQWLVVRLGLKNKEGEK